MNMKSQQPGLQHVRKVLQANLSNPDTCLAAIDAAESLIKHIWEFNSRLLGDGGARAVLARAVSLAVADAPLLQKVTVNKKGLDSSQLREHVENAGCDAGEVLNSFIHLGEMIFFTLADLTGDLMTAPLLQQLERDK